MDKILDIVGNLFSSYELYGIEINKTNLWLTLDTLKENIIKIGKTLGSDFYQIDDDVYIAKDSLVSESAEIHGPCIIGHNVEIRHSAFIRGSVVIGDNAVIGNSVEIKNSMIFNNAEVPHFNYIGDSILGEHAHFGAGSLTSNLRSDKKWASMKTLDGDNIEIGRRKAGALVGDYAEIGCNTVLNPGTVIGSNTLIYPLSSVRNIIPSNMIFKTNGKVVIREKR